MWEGRMDTSGVSAVDFVARCAAPPVVDRFGQWMAIFPGLDTMSVVLLT